MSVEEVLLIVVSVAVIILLVVVTTVLITVLIVLRRLKDVSQQLKQVSVVSTKAAERFAPLLGLVQFIKIIKKARR